MIIQWIKARAWMLGATGAAVIALLLGVQLAVAKFEIRHQDKVIEQNGKQLSILRRDLAQARTNEGTLQAALNRANEATRLLADESARRLAESEQKLADAQKRTSAAERRAGAIISYQPHGETECERLLDVDRQFREDLK